MLSPTFDGIFGLNTSDHLIDASNCKLRLITIPLSIFKASTMLQSQSTFIRFSKVSGHLKTNDKAHVKALATKFMIESVSFEM